MFEPQDHPNDFLYPGGPPIPPYDVAGWTLAYQMNVKFDRLLDGFTGPFERVPGFDTPPVTGRVAGAARPAGWYFGPVQNDAFQAANRLIAAGFEVRRVPRASRAGGRAFAPGTFWVASAGAAGDSVRALARELGVDFTAASRPGNGARLRPLRVGLWDRYGGSIPSGWVRWIFDQFRFPYQVVYAPELDAGNLNAKYDVLVFVSDGIPESDRQGRGGFGGMPDASAVPAEYRAQLGNVSVAQTVPQLRTFLENGGTVVTIGGSAALARHLGLPVYDALVERAADGTEHHLPNEKFYIPGSILRAAVDTTRPVSYGVGSGGEIDVFYDNSPAFRLKSDAAAQGVRPLAWFASASPLRSGWAWGQSYLNGAVAAAEAKVGKGTLYLFAPEITFRAQPYGTFKWLFNGIYTPITPTTAM
jgi:hypothetical protein